MRDGKVSQVRGNGRRGNEGRGYRGNKRRVSKISEERVTGGNEGKLGWIIRGSKEK